MSDEEEPFGAKMLLGCIGNMGVVHDHFPLYNVMLNEALNPKLHDQVQYQLGAAPWPSTAVPCPLLYFPGIPSPASATVLRGSTCTFLLNSCLSSGEMTICCVCVSLPLGDACDGDG